MMMTSKQIPMIMDCMHNYTKDVVMFLSKEYEFRFEDAYAKICEYQKSSIDESHSKEGEASLRKEMPDIVDDMDSYSDMSSPVSSTVESDVEQISISSVSDSESSAVSSDSESVTEKLEKKSSEEAKTQSNQRPPYPKTIYPLPFTGVVYDSCNGIKPNFNLFTQCPNNPSKTSTKGLCKTCDKQAQINFHNKPNCGLIQDRVKEPFGGFRDPRKKRPVTLGSVIITKKLKVEDVRKEFQEKNISIPDILWQEKWENTKTKKENKKTKKENKKEQHTVIVSESDTESEQEPKENQKLETHSDVLIEQKLSKEESHEESDEADQSDMATTEEYESDHNQDDEEEEELDVKEFKIDNMTYFKDDDNNLYDMETHEKVGIYDVEEEMIIPVNVVVSDTEE